MTTFIPGYLAGLTVNLVDLGIFGNIIGSSLRKTVNRKPVFGSQAKRAISGQTEGSLNFGGHLAAEGPLADLLTAFNLVTPVAFEIQMGSGATDAGTLTGNLILSSLEITADAEGEWEWTAAGELDGAIVHTPAV